MVVVVGDGGGSGKGWGTSHRVTAVTFQPRLLDLATRGGRPALMWPGTVTSGHG
jgi:hypothetical protein